MINEVIKVKFPKIIGYKNVSPLEHFYKKCLKKAGVKMPEKIKTTAFFINPRNTNFLKSFILKAIEHQYGFGGKKAKESVAFEWFLHGPTEANGVPIEEVWIDLKELYSTETEHD